MYAKGDCKKWTAHISNNELKCFEIAVNGSSIHVVVGGDFLHFWSRLALQPENRCKTSNRPARERTRCIRTSIRESSRDRATLRRR
jgi:hypothetical protein